MFLAVVVSAQQIPPGTALPVVLSTKLDISNAQPGQAIIANLAQSVPLPSKRRIPSGARVTGRVLSVRANRDGSDSLTLRFDKVRVEGRDVAVTTSLRALASAIEVQNAQLPTHGLTGAETPNRWTTRQVGGDDVYRGGGGMMHEDKPVGQPVGDGVMAELLPVEGSICNTGSEGKRLALWVFSSTACGIYGYPHLHIVRPGNGDPVGEIVLQSWKHSRVGTGSALLLVTVDGSAPAPSK